MRFMMVVKSDEQAEAGELPDKALIAAMEKYNEELKEAGALLALDGLHPSSKGARVTFSGAKRTVTHGPFPGAKELVAGYWLIRVKSKEEAIEWAKRIPLERGVVELRQVQEVSDWPAELREATSEEPLMREHRRQ